MDMKAKTEQLALKQFLLQDCAGFGLGRSNRPCQNDPWASQLHASIKLKENMLFVSDTFGLIFFEH